MTNTSSETNNGIDKAEGNHRDTIAGRSPRTRLTVIVALAVVCLLCGGAFYYLFMSPFTDSGETRYLYVDTDDNIDSVRTKIRANVSPRQMTGFNLLCQFTSYPSQIRTGRYEVTPVTTTLTFFRALKGGNQTPLMLSIPSTWTKEMVAGRIASRLMADSAALASAMNDQALCQTYQLDTNTIASILIPNTYEVYWDITPEDFVDRMFKESERFWNADRTAKAEALGMSRNEVVTLASIVDGETANDAEKPVIAGLYINRLNKGMPLQSDPTVKYALGDFELRRIYAGMLRTPSPYNTYLNKGLPPSPIRIPAVASIDAVLDYDQNDYIFMCAKEDFSGTHNFATSYAQHKQNARRYAGALNERKIQ